MLQAALLTASKNLKLNYSIQQNKNFRFSYIDTSILGLVGYGLF
jgi:hypothetical protein